MWSFVSYYFIYVDYIDKWLKYKFVEKINKILFF